MALTNWGFLYVADGCDPDRDVCVVETGTVRTVLVGLGQPAQGPAVAARLVADGAQLIELCGAFGPEWTARVIKEVGDRVPVGSVSYGPEAVTGLHAVFS
ncbi:hypothetical protein HS041_21935 [Planomonospora sp. ID67723]|uniref:DUF6506 family protein n=1 Tax=Planomonospora sp. ID67723 TaxID=2738134 RepID=UPI0018C43D46|nr:DUF6506 family protein [Planomonospora sp. ID67723]MBG0830424.1 hypothetical protein [Planomonospora sp. ID67723]